MSVIYGITSGYAILAATNINCDATSIVTGGDIGATTITTPPTFISPSMEDNINYPTAMTQLITSIVPQIVSYSATTSYTGAGPYNLDSLVPPITGPGIYDFDNDLNLSSDFTLPGTGVYLFRVTGTISFDYSILPGSNNLTNITFYATGFINLNLLATKSYAGAYIGDTIINGSNTAVNGRLFAYNGSIGLSQGSSTSLNPTSTFPITLGDAATYAALAGQIIFGTNNYVYVNYGANIINFPPVVGTNDPLNVITGLAALTTTNVYDIPISVSFYDTPTIDLSLLSLIITGPGVYYLNNDVINTANYTLPGSGNYLFIIQGNITFDYSILPGLNDPSNITFYATGNINLNGLALTNSYDGTYIGGNITTGDNTTVNGRLLSTNDLTFGSNNTINPPAPICFVKGTKIMTNKGFVPIEDICPDDNVVTSGIIMNHKVTSTGFMKTPVVFVGHFSEHNLTNISRPIVISKDALGKNVPTEDVRVSPNHAIVVKNRTIFAKDLLNGHTIYRDMECDSVVYYHIMLKNHFTLNASGLWSESLKGCAERFIAKVSKIYGKRNNVITKKFH